MKHKILVGLIASLAASSAFAQTSVTVYGVIDTAIRYTTNQVTSNGGTGSQLALTEGAFQGPRVGFKGEEDLGGGMAAVFKLENGFQSNNGAFDQQGQLFGRQEYIGLKDKTLGEIDAGRQYGAAFDLLGNYDPLGVGNFNENEWEFFLFGGRFDNTLKYTNSWGPVAAEVTYSLGGQSGANSVGATEGFTLAYSQGPFSIGGVYQESKAAAVTGIAGNPEVKVWGLGGSFVAGPATLYLSYFDAKRDAGFAKAGSNSGGPLANTSLIGNGGNTLQRTDDMWTAGVLFQATPALGLTFGYMHDAISNESSLGDNGKISTLYAVADYNLSKRTDVYFDVDYTTLKGGEITDANTIFNFEGVPTGGNSSRTGLAAGLRVKF